MVPIVPGLASEFRVEQVPRLVEVPASSPFETGNGAQPLVSGFAAEPELEKLEAPAVADESVVGVAA